MAWAKVKELSAILSGPTMTETCLDSGIDDHASTEKKTSRLVQGSVADARVEEGLAPREMLAKRRRRLAALTMVTIDWGGRRN